MKSPKPILIIYFRDYLVLSKLVESDILRDTGDLMFVRNDLRKLIIHLREKKYNWFWRESSIGKLDGQYVLPSVDMAYYLGLRSNNQLEGFLKKHTKIKAIWDTESGAWYPAFKTKEDAIFCIKEVNRIFDEIVFAQFKKDYPENVS